MKLLMSVSVIYSLYLYYIFKAMIDINYLIIKFIGCDATSFAALVLLDVVLIAIILREVILSIPLGTVSNIVSLMFTPAFFLTFWLVDYIIINTVKRILSGYLSEDYVLYGQVVSVLIVVLPTAIYLYILYSVYLKSTYLSANDLKRHRLKNY